MVYYEITFMKNMNRFSIYILLIFIYLGLSKSFAPSEKKAPFIKNQYLYSNYFKGAPIMAILVDYFKTGFLIKTYFHKYKILHGFKTPETIIARVSKKFYEKNIPYLGMSLFRRKEKMNEENTIPMPPGTLYINDPFYGRWVYTDSGQKVWSFHRGYRHFPDVFGWGDFRPTKKFATQLKIHLANEKPFWGLHKEFGLEGKVSLEFLSKNQKTIKKIDQVKDHLKKSMSLPWPYKRTRKFSSGDINE